MAEIVCNHLSQVCLLIPKWYGMSEMNKKKITEKITKYCPRHPIAVFLNLFLYAEPFWHVKMFAEPFW
jgi:hypothetical protein